MRFVFEGQRIESLIGLLPYLAALPFIRYGPFCLSKNGRKKDTKNPNSLGWASAESFPHPAAILHSDSGFFESWVGRLFDVF